MNSTALTLTETALLSQLPHSSQVVSPTQRVFIKHPDGIWWNWANGVCTNRRLQPAHDIPAGSWVCLPNESTRPHYVKHANGSWLAANPSSAAFAANNPVPALQILPQTTFRRGPAPVDQCIVPFNVSMPAAEQGRVPDATSHAFVGELAAQEKATIRFRLQHLESSGYQHRQHNLQRYGAPVVRGQLAISIAEEVRRVMDALEEIGKPLRLPSGRRVAFEDLVLVDIKRVSRGSLQPTLAVRGA